MSRPTLKAHAGRYVLEWSEEQVVIEFNRVHLHQDGRITAEIRVFATCEGVPPHLHQAQFNLLSSRARTDLARILHERYAIDWATILEQACVLTLEALRQGEPVEDLDSEAMPPPVRWLFEPLLVRGQPTLVFADGGTGKSYLALLIALSMLTRWEDNPLGAIPPQAPGRVLYLDWETDGETTLGRWARLAWGCGRPQAHLDYRKCLVPLSEEVDIVQRLIAEREVSLVVVDSIAGAAGGDLNENAPARLFYQALRPLNVTSLLIAHTAKNAERKRTPFGSAFFYNMARLVFELRQVQEGASDALTLGLFCRKANDGRKHAPLGYHLAFEPDSVAVQRQRVQDIAEFSGELPLAHRIQELLLHGPATSQEIAAELGAKEDVVRTTLSRLAKKEGVLRLTQGKWGVVARPGEASD